MRHRKNILLVVGLVAGFLLGRGVAPRRGLVTPESGSPTPTAGKTEIWTCSMHPQIRQPGPGLCPICGMDLIPAVTDSGASADPPTRVTLSPAARQLAEVAVAMVERRGVPVEVRLSGKVQFDETRVAYITTRVPGRVDKLHANYVGMPVKPGDPLADLYSPDLVSAQQELLQALKASGHPTLLEAARERLRLWGLTSAQIAGIEQSGRVRDHVTFEAPRGGVVVDKDAREGLYVETGTRLFTVADLTRVWVVLDAYESDLPWLREGQHVEFQADARPGEVFEGQIAFIEPVLDPVTRTVRVRVEAANEDGRLKPGLFVRAVVHAGVPSSTASKEAAEPPLVIPATAPLLTGKRAIVYVAVPDEEGAYEGREVVLGPRAGDWYIVQDGLREGERVVVNGAFKIDSSLQIQGRPSMMTPEGAAPAQPSHAHE